MFCPEYTAKLTHDGCVGKDKSARHVCSVKGGRRKLKAKSISLHRREEPRRNMGSSYPKSEEACYIPDIYCCDTQHLYSLPLPTSSTLPGIFWLMNLVLNMLSYQNTGARHWSRLEKKQVRFNSFSFWLLLQSWVGLTTLHYCPLRASDLLGISFSPLLPYISWLVILLLKQLADWVLWPLFHVGCLPYTVIPVWMAECMPFRSIYSVLHVAPEVWLEQSLKSTDMDSQCPFLTEKESPFPTGIQGRSCDGDTQKVRQEDGKFKVSLGYPVSRRNRQRKEKKRFRGRRTARRTPGMWRPETDLYYV